MRVLVCALGDNASVNIRDRLLDSGDWQQANGTFRGHPIMQRGYDVLVTIDGMHIHDEALAPDLHELGWPIKAVWFLSRHRAASGNPSLTVHPIGNPGEAEFGGRPGELSVVAALDMYGLLHALRSARDAAGLPHDVTYEATHHGPYMDIPCLFVEVGSDEAWYDDVPSGQAVADAITAVLDEDGPPDVPVVVAVGGGHYVPRMTDKARAGEAAFGHMLANYTIDADREDPGLIEEAVRKTPGCVGVFIVKKGLKGPQKQAVKDWCEAAGVPLWPPTA